MYIDQTRSLLDTRITALVGESYTRAYNHFVTLHQLSELEEILHWKCASATNKLPQQREQRGGVRHGRRIATGEENKDDPLLSRIKANWKNRLLSVQRTPEAWQRILGIHATVVPPHENQELWLKFSKLCLRNDMVSLSERILRRLLLKSPHLQQKTVHTSHHDRSRRSGRQLQLRPGTLYREEKSHQQHQLFRNSSATALSSSSSSDEAASNIIDESAERTSTLSLAMSPQADPHVTFIVLQHYHQTCEDQGHVYELLREFTSSIRESDCRVTSSLLAHAYLTLGKWERAQDSKVGESKISSILRSFKQAIEFDPKWYKAWHWWALMNFEAISHYEKALQLGSGAVPSSLTSSPARRVNASSTPSDESLYHKIRTHVVPAIRGLYQAIALGASHKHSNIQDTLRLLTIWFKHAGTNKEAEHAIRKGFSTVSIVTWLEVMPQLIARIHSNIPPVKRLIHELLCKVADDHPQALVYPLTVASKSQSYSRSEASNQILHKIRQNSPKSRVLVEQASMVSDELIRVSIIWHEMWHEAIEEASRQYFGEKNIEEMFRILEPLHILLEKGGKTVNQIAFQRMYGRDLQEAWEWCKNYRHASKKNVNDLNQAWDLYCHVFRRIYKQLQQITNLELAHISPKLSQAHDLQISVPGTYHANIETVAIRSFASNARVISSKQRPRRFTIHGSDGMDYLFLLKGHEDLRQDERVMQLFGLVNTLLASDNLTSSHHLSIQRYSVIPLSPNSGLIGWVPHCDTLHQLIRSYRDSRKIVLNIEHKLMLRMAPDYDNLSLIQKIEVFEHALDSTNGQDLNRVLWLKSRNSETWLERRSNYTRSLAVMSMVGYILGLGDRHPSNLMLDRHTGNIIHIDFGDCFEVAMQREKYPEKIPFRLTRMLIHAMEVSGIEGTFRITCERVMRVLRENKESLMAVLEAFVYDPLINWRLLQPNEDQSPIMVSNGGNAPSNTPQNRRHSPRTAASSSDEYSPSTSSPYSPDSASFSSFTSSPSMTIAFSSNSYSFRSGGSNCSEPSSIRKTTIPITHDVLNEKALAVIDKVDKKLRGRDFDENEVLPVASQVDRLIEQATSNERLCVLFIGWCSFW